jgi:hypothetical protein
MKNKSTTYYEKLGVLAPSVPALLARMAPDRQMVLTAKLTLHYFVKPSELPRLDLGRFIFDRHLPTGFLVPRSGGLGSERRIDIAPDDRFVMGALLPKSGTLLRDADPFGRLRRFAAKHDVNLTRDLAWRSCIQYWLTLGTELDAVVQMAGLESQTYHPHNSNPVSRGEARHYFRPVAISRIKALPWR